ncbi:MAG: hypothetical protein AAGK04_10495 [Planctomycetota bacterium]
MQILWWRAERAQIVDDEEKVWASISRVNVLADEAQVLRDDLGPERVVAWAGWAEGDPVAGEFQADPSVWLPSGRERFGRFASEGTELARSCGSRLLWRPHAATALSDLPGCVALSKMMPDTGMGLLADPFSLLTPDTLGDAEDHLRRAGEVFAAIDGVEAVVLAPNASARASVGVDVMRRTLAPLLDGRWAVILEDGDRIVQRRMLEAITG